MKKKYEFWDKLSLKCVLVGDTGVGKSSLAARLTSRTFKTDYEPTLFDNFAATVSVEDKPFHLSLFDTAGKEDFNKLRVLSYIKSDVFIVCFSVNNPESLHHVSEVWVPELKQYVPDTPFIVVGTNIDVRFQQPDVQVMKSSVISAKIGNEIANRVGAVSYVECSSLTGEGMDDLAREIVAAAHHKKGSKCSKPVTCCNCEIL